MKLNRCAITLAVRRSTGFKVELHGLLERVRKTTESLVRVRQAPHVPSWHCWPGLLSAPLSLITRYEYANLYSTLTRRLPSHNTEQDLSRPILVVALQSCCFSRSTIELIQSLSTSGCQFYDLIFAYPSHSSATTTRCSTRC